MALRNTASDNKQFRHRLQHIKLEPSTSAYDISIELLVDGKKIHKIQKIKKGQPLYWSELCLPCDVYETSTVTFRITEIHAVRDQVELATYQMTQAAGRDTLSIASASGKYTVLLTFLSDGAAEQAYQQAFAKVGLVGNQPSVPKAGSRAGAAFKTLLALGSTMAEVAPTAGAKEVFTICAKALQ
ncbi:hypothetical protein FRC08_005839, partial [Ceratobasidium sp. 394]